MRGKPASRSRWRAARTVGALGLAVLAGACTLSDAVHVRLGRDPSNQDDLVRFRTTYYFRTFDVCEAQDVAKFKAAQTAGGRIEANDVFIRREAPVKLLKDSLYRFTMTGKASPWSRVHFESGTLKSWQIDPFGAIAAFDKQNNRFYFKSQESTQSDAETSELMETIARFTALKEKIRASLPKKKDKDGKEIPDMGADNPTIQAIDNVIINRIREAADGAGDPLRGKLVEVDLLYFGNQSDKAIANAEKAVQEAKKLLPGGAIKATDDALSSLNTRKAAAAQKSNAAPAVQVLESVEKAAEIARGNAEDVRKSVDALAAEVAKADKEAADKRKALVSEILGVSGGGGRIDSLQGRVALPTEAAVKKAANEAAVTLLSSGRSQDDTEKIEKVIKTFRPQLKAWSDKIGGSVYATADRVLKAPDTLKAAKPKVEEAAGKIEFARTRSDAFTDALFRIAIREMERIVLEAVDKEKASAIPESTKPEDQFPNLGDSFKGESGLSSDGKKNLNDVTKDNAKVLAVAAFSAARGAIADFFDSNENAAVTAEIKSQLIAMKASRKALDDALDKATDLETQRDKARQASADADQALARLRNLRDRLRGNPPSPTVGSDSDKCPPGSRFRRGFQVLGPEGVKVFDQDDRLIMAMSTSASPLMQTLRELSARVLQQKASQSDRLLPLAQERVRLLRAERAAEDLAAAEPKDIGLMIDGVLEALGEKKAAP